MTAHRWWTRAELDAVDLDPTPAGGREPLWPKEIPRLLDLADAWSPGAEVVDLDDVEESTVPVDAA